jgi:hypothetical protein
VLETSSSCHGPEPPEARKADPDPCAPARLGTIKHPCAGRIVGSSIASSQTSSTQSANSSHSAIDGNIDLSSQKTAGRRRFAEADLRYSEDILQGIDHAPGAIGRLYRGENTGKRLIRIR